MTSIFNYPKKQIIIFSSILAIVLIVVIIFIGVYYSRSADLRLVSQAEIIANAMETYYDKFNNYPIIQETNLNQIKSLSDQGFNQTGGRIFYKLNGSWSRSATILSSGSSYVIKFSLKNSWPVWQLTSWRGGQCRLTNNVVMTCENK
jgi:hypothetical protein